NIPVHPILPSLQANRITSAPLCKGPAVAGEGDRAKHGGGGSTAKEPPPPPTAVQCSRFLLRPGDEAAAALPADPRGGILLHFRHRLHSRLIGPAGAIAIQVRGDELPIDDIAQHLVEIGGTIVAPVDV